MIMTIVICILFVVLYIVYICSISKAPRKSFSLTDPVDIVITFVDSKDLYWKQERDKCLKLYDPTYHNPDSVSDERFYNRNELKYCLRSIDKFAKWMRNIYLVVSSKSQIPSYINPTNTRLKIILHSDIMNDSDLPTFNSQAIEANLYKIKDLSDNFIYFNDDIFLGRETDIKNFINDDGKFVYHVTNIKVRKGTPHVREVGSLSAWKNTSKYLDSSYVNEERYTIAHEPSILNKQLIAKIWSDIYDKLKLTSSEKFRSVNDLNLTCAFHQYVAMYKNKAVIEPLNSMYVPISCDKNVNKQRLDDIKNNSPVSFCLNDICPNNKDIDKQIVTFLEEYYPEKSVFEI